MEPFYPRPHILPTADADADTDEARSLPTADADEARSLPTADADEAPSLASAAHSLPSAGDRMWFHGKRVFLHGSNSETLAQYHDAFASGDVDSRMVYVYYKYQALDCVEPAGAYARGVKYGLIEPGFQGMTNLSMLLSFHAVVQENQGADVLLVNCVARDNAGAAFFPDRSTKTPTACFEGETLLWLFVPRQTNALSLPIGNAWSDGFERVQVDGGQ